MPSTSTYSPLPSDPPLDRSDSGKLEPAAVLDKETVTPDSGSPYTYSTPTPKLGDSSRIPTLQREGSSSTSDLAGSGAVRIPLSPDQEMSYTETRDEEEGDGKPEGEAASVW